MSLRGLTERACLKLLDLWCGVGPTRPTRHVVEDPNTLGYHMMRGGLTPEAREALANSNRPHLERVGGEYLEWVEAL